MDENSIREQLLTSEVKTLTRPWSDAQSSPYTPINLSVLIPKERITFNLYVKVAQKGSQNVSYPLFLKEGEAWERQWLDLLTQKGIDRLYFLSENLERVIGYLNNYLQMLKYRSVKVTPELLAVFSEQLNYSIRRAYQSPRFGPGVQKSQGLVEGLIESLQQDPAAVKLVWKVLYHNFNIYNHSINLCLMGTAFMLFLKKSGKESRDLGLAGLYHDIGMTRIPQQIILKDGPLTPGEREEVNHHPAMGHRLLSKGTSLAYLPNEVLRLSLEHHENADGSGYPLGLPLNRQHPWTRIMRLLDTYEALTVTRPYRAAYKPFEAVKILQEARGPRGPIYDPQTLKNFIAFLIKE
ncbi:MAG: HD domain-containing protein [Deltaproteobacteria bacterium]|nr:MAG: HD domain-containing protein [Deltaproteobacteria bacterium]